MMAAKNGHLKIVEALLEMKGTPVETKDKVDRKTALMIGAHWGYLDTVRVLLKGKANIHAINK